MGHSGSESLYPCRSSAACRIQPLLVGNIKRSRVRGRTRRTLGAVSELGLHAVVKRHQRRTDRVYSESANWST